MDYSDWPRWSTAALILVAGFYLLIPWLIYHTQRMNGDPRIVIFDAEENRLPPGVAEYFDDCGESLLGLGFEPYPCVALPDPMPNVRAICQVWVHPERRDATLVSAIFGVARRTPARCRRITRRFSAGSLTRICQPFRPITRKSSAPSLICPTNRRSVSRK